MPTEFYPADLDDAVEKFLAAARRVESIQRALGWGKHKKLDQWQDRCSDRLAKCRADLAAWAGHVQWLEIYCHRDDRAVTVVVELPNVWRTRLDSLRKRAKADGFGDDRAAAARWCIERVLRTQNLDGDDDHGRASSTTSGPAGDDPVDRRTPGPRDGAGVSELAERRAPLGG